MAKKSTLSLKTERRELLDNCQELISRFRVTSTFLNIGAAATAAMGQQVSTISGASTQTGNTPSVCLGPPEILSLVQAAMVQEWHVYLDTLFGAVVAHMLKIHEYSRMPSQTVDIRSIGADSLVEIRQKVATRAMERFSLQPYDRRVDTICEMFNVHSQDASLGELQKHVGIRNIFQHNRAMVRQSDLKQVGKTFFEIRDGQSAKKYLVGDKLVLTVYEVEQLGNTLEALSKSFEVWK
jgi:hypothetical protein